MSNRTIKTCSVDGCEKPIFSRLWCSRHYQRWLKYGDPIKAEYEIFSTPEESFDARTEWQENCLVWTGYRSPGGYGRIWVYGDPMQAHRWQWEKHRGPIPKGKVVDHTCHNRACVNVEHLRISSQTNNTFNRAGANKSSVTGIRNVSRSGDKYTVRIGKNRKQHYFGTYETIEEAAAAAEHARKELFGDYAGRH